MSKKSGRDQVLEIDQELRRLYLRNIERKREWYEDNKRMKELDKKASQLAKGRGFLKVDVGLHEAGGILKLCAERGNMRVITDVHQKYRRIRITVLSDKKHLLRYAIGKGSVYLDVWSLAGFQNVQAVLAATWQYLPESTKVDARVALRSYHELGKGKT